MKKYLLPLILILFLIFTSTGNCAWLSSWDKRIELAIGDYAGDIGAGVTWFPVDVFLTTTQAEEVFVELTTDAEYKKIQFTQSDGTSLLYGHMKSFVVEEGVTENFERGADQQGIIGDVAGSDYWGATKIVVSIETLCTAASIYLETRSGTVVGDMTFRLETDVGGSPSGTLAHASATGTLTPTDDAWNKRSFTPFVLSKGTYWLVLYVADQAETNYLKWTLNTGGVNIRSVSTDHGSSWTEDNYQPYFRLYGKSRGVFTVSADGWTINANTSIFLYYDKDHADNNTYIGVTNTAACEAVYNAEYTAVYPMDDGVDNAHIYDATDNNNDGTKTGANAPAEASTKIGQGQDFDAAGLGKIDIGTGANPTTNDFTVEAWMKSVAGQNCYLVCNRETSSPYSGFYFLSQVDNKLYFQLNDQSNYHVFDSGVGIVNDNSWHYVALVVDHTNDLAHLYVDGAVDAGNIDISAVASADITSTNTIWIGADETDGQYTAKLLDEIRISNIDRSAAWMKGTYNSGDDSLFTYGSEEEVSIVEVNVIFFGANF